MPLSEHEERALAEIARRLSEEDPRFVATVSQTTVGRVHRRRLRFAIAGAVVGFITLLGLTFHLALGVAGFALMLTSVVVAGRAVRALAESGEDPLNALRRGDGSD